MAVLQASFSNCGNPNWRWAGFVIFIHGGFWRAKYDLICPLALKCALEMNAVWPRRTATAFADTLSQIVTELSGPIVQLFMERRHVVILGARGEGTR